MGKSISYLSNNSSKNKDDYSKKLQQLGLPCEPSDVVLSTDSALNYLKEQNIHKVFVLGTKSLQKVVIDAGYEICSYEPEFVLIGYDTELSYSKLITACRLINSGVDFLATHCDLVCPSEVGPIPDIGTLINMLESTTGRKVYKTFGKPEIELINDICTKNALDKKDVIMVGDRLYTDIKMANNASIDSILVLSGDTSREELETTSEHPTYVLKSLADII